MPIELLCPFLPSITVEKKSYNAEKIQLNSDHSSQCLYCFGEEFLVYKQRQVILKGRLNAKGIKVYSYTFLVNLN